VSVHYITNQSMNINTLSAADRRALVKTSLAVIRSFVPAAEYHVLSRSEELAQVVVDNAEKISKAARTYETDGQGEAALVQLHYFNGNSDWYILELDKDGILDEAFGWMVLGGDLQFAELGYVSINELCANGVELDLHWTPRPLATVKAERN
jgi:hypothetical protein